MTRFVQFIRPNRSNQLYKQERSTTTRSESNTIKYLRLGFNSRLMLDVPFQCMGSIEGRLKQYI